MELVLLGTGDASGWPNPWCDCDSCTTLRSRDEVRAQTAVLVDGVLLLDFGPEAPRQALRAGRSLAAVRHVVITHGHPDHTSPMAVVWRTWARRTEPLDVVGPPAVLAAFDDHLGPDDPVTRRAVGAGDELELDGGYRLRVLAAAHAGPEIGPAVLHDLTGPDGARVLYATDTAALPPQTLTAVEGAAYDAVLLEQTWGDGAGPGDHHGLDQWVRTVGALRERGAVTDATQLVAVHLGHRNPPQPELDRRLAEVGGRALPDGSVLQVGPAARPGRRVLVLGGARSGKSAYAEGLVATQRAAVTYVATGRDRPDDPEWTARLAAHRARRPPHWRTVETADLAGALSAAEGAMLVDAVTLWLAAVLDEPDLGERVDAVVAAWTGTAGRVVAVSDEVGSGVVPESAAGRRFRDQLGSLNVRLAAAADEVWLVTAGIPRRLR